MRHHRVYRSPLRLFFWAPAAVVAVIAGALAGAHGAGGGWFAVVVGAAIALFALWPSVSIGEAGVTVRNLRTVFVPWPEVREVRIGDQLPYIGGFWRLLHNANDAPIGRHQGYPGVLIERVEGAVVAVMAAQRPPIRLGSGTPWADHVKAEIEHARPRPT